MKTNKKLLLSISNTYHIHKTFFQRRQRSSTTKKLDAEAVYFNEVRYLDPRTSRWLGVDPAMHQGDYIPSAPIDDEARKRNGNLPGQGGIYNYVNMHVYHYAGNNPEKYKDPNGRDLKIVDEPFAYEGSKPQHRLIERNRTIITVNLSIMLGCDIIINKEGFISMGKIIKTGAEWDAVRARFSELLDSDKVVGITTNAVGFASGGWGFNPIDKYTDREKSVWANRNGISAYANISDKVNYEYKHNNPNYKSFWSSIFSGERKYIYVPESIGGATAHEVLGHATNYANNVRDSEHFNLYGENLYHKAAGEPTRDVYP